MQDNNRSTLYRGNDTADKIRYDAVRDVVKRTTMVEYEESVFTEEADVYEANNEAAKIINEAEKRARERLALDQQKGKEGRKTDVKTGAHGKVSGWPSSQSQTPNPKQDGPEKHKDKNEPFQGVS